MKYSVLAAGAALAMAGGVAADFNQPIVGGEQISSPSDYPWMVSLQLSGNRHNCGGFLIQNNVVMTAAHCLGPTYAGVRIKGVGLRAVDGEFFTIKRIFEHEEFSSVTAGRDIALLELNPRSDGTFSDVTPVQWDNGNELHDGKTSRAIGWGALSQGGGSPLNLQQVDLPVRTNADCALGYGSRVKPDMICAGVDQGGIDACQGDSGGPLFLDGANQLVIGVVSWGEGCARPNRLGVYARIAELKGWVQGKLDIINATPTSSPTAAPTEAGQTVPPCEDSPVGFYDVDGPRYNCAWYSQGDRCERYGNAYRNPTFDNKNANEACCVCGGGTTGRTSEDVERLGAPQCQCDGGEGFFDKCAYSLPWMDKALCIIDFRGPASLQPKCLVPEEVELKYSQAYQRWVAIGCTPQPRLANEAVVPYDVPVFTQETTTPEDNTPDNTPEEKQEPSNAITYALGGAAGGVAAAGLVAAAIVTYNKNKQEIPTQTVQAGDNFDSFRVASEKA